MSQTLMDTETEQTTQTTATTTTMTIPQLAKPETETEAMSQPTTETTSDTNTITTTALDDLKQNLFLANVEMKGRAGQLFGQLFGVPVMPDPSDFELSVHLLDRYYNTHEKLNLWLRDFPDWTTYRKEYARLSQRLITFVNNAKQGLDQVVLQQLGTNKSDNKWPIKAGKLYNTTNAGSKYISLDVRRANFTVLQKRFPELFNGKDSWEAFAADFTNKKVLKECKRIRQVVIGKTDLTQVSTTLCSTFMLHLYNVLVSEGHIQGDNANVVHANVDELVLRDDETFTLPQEFENTVRVERFYLRQLGQRSMYAKEYSDGKVEFKCVPKAMLREAVELYERELHQIEGVAS